MLVWLNIENCDRDNGWLQLHLWLGFMITHNYVAGGYTYIGYRFCLDSDSSDSDSINSDSDIDSDSVCKCFHLQFGFMIAQNYQAGEYINIRYALFPLSSNSCDSETDNDSDSG